MSANRSVDRCAVTHQEDRSAVTHEKDRSTATHQNDRSTVTYEKGRSAATHQKDRSCLCTFTFADGRQCRTPRSAAHPHFCTFHARREAQSLAADEAGRDISSFLSGSYLSACDLSCALGRLFSAVAQGQLKPKTATTLAYLGQTLVQSIQLAENEYINAFGTDYWRDTVRSSFAPPALPESAPKSDPST